MGEFDRGKEEQHRQKLMEMFADVDPDNCVLLAMSRDGKNLHSYNFFQVDAFKKAILTLMSDPMVNEQVRSTAQFLTNLVGSCMVNTAMRNREN